MSDGKLTAVSWKKKTAQAQRPADPFSVELQELAKLADQREFAVALSRIDRLLAVEMESSRKAQLLLLVAGIEERKRGFESAMEAFQAAAKFGGKNSSILSAAGAGQARVLLAQGDVDKATAAADGLLAACELAAAGFDAALEKAKKDLSFSDRSFLPEYPASRSDVANSLAVIFEAAGQGKAARAYWEKSREFGKSAAAEIGLARLAASSGDQAAARQFAYSALVTSHFRASSLGAIPLVLRNCPKEEQTVAARKILDGLKQARGAVRDRGVYEVVASLRAAQNLSWIEIAEDWLGESGKENPVIAAELRKLLLVEARKQQGNPAAARARAEDLLATARLAPAEWIMAAKEFVRGELAAGSSPNFESLLVDGCARYGDSYLPRFAHSMGIACAASGRDDLAEALLRKGIGLVPFTERQWAQSMWQLAAILHARSETNQQFADCNRVWDAIASNPNVEAKFRVCARLKWLEILSDQGDKQAAVDKYDEIASLCRSLEEVTSLLLVARNLPSLDKKISKLGEESLDRAIAISGLGKKDVLSKSDVKSLLAINLIRLDYRRMDDIVADWNRLAASFGQGGSFLSTDFWGFAAVTVAAYGLRQRWADAAGIVEWVVAHPAVTPYGKVAVWSMCGKLNIYEWRRADAFRFFEKADRLQLMAPESGVASYWLGLRAFKAGKSEVAEKHFARCLDIFSDESSFTLRRLILVKVLLLKANYSIEALPKRYGKYSEAFKNRCLASLKIDLEKVG